MDVIRRWGSTYIMLKRLIGKKDFCFANIPIADQLSHNDWKALENIVVVLEPANELTLKLQTKQLLIGVFYIIWMKLCLTLKDLDPEIGINLLNCAEFRQTCLFENNIYLDPRFRR